MKKYVIIAATALASCAGNTYNKNNTGTAATTDTTAAVTTPLPDGQYCFVRTEGTAHQDTATVQLNITGTQVTGQMVWLPKEKDKRKGSLTGTLDGDDINAVWRFMQEGMKDSIKLAFKLLPQKLAQKPLKAAANGGQQTDEAAGYTVEYAAVNCSQ